MSSKLFLGVVLILVGCALLEVSSVRLSVSSLDESKRAIIGEFRELVEKDLPHQYMREDTFLLRFLSAKNFQIKEAVDLLNENLAWREANKIDSILEEDWSEFERRFPTQLTTVTMDGRPVLYVPHAQWDLSAIVASGEEQRFMRYASAKIMEEADRKVRSLMREDVAQFDIIVNMDGVSKEKHGCLQCNALMLKVFLASETHYGYAIDNFIYVNSPPEAEPSFHALLAALQNDDSRQSFKRFEGRDAWEPVLLQYISTEELPEDLH